MPCGMLYLIPQACAANGTEGIYLEVKYTVDGNPQKTLNIPFDVDWKFNTQYTYNVKLGTDNIEL